VAFRTRRKYRQIHEWIERKLATINEAPIFVLGNQKSGTTAISVLLAERAGLSFDYDLTVGHSSLIVDIYQGTAPLSALVAENQLEFSREVVKDPNLTFLYEPLRERFPEAKFGMVVRDPRDNIRSILDRLELAGDKTTLDPSWSEQMTNGWGRVIDGGWMGIEGETYIDHLAGRWKRAARIYLDHQDNIELIRYEDFVEGKVSAIDDLVSRLGEELKNGIEEKVDQQYQPRGGRRDADWLSVFGEENLERIESKCTEEMRALGYTNFRILS